MAILPAALIGMALAVVGAIPRNILYFANMQLIMTLLTVLAYLRLARLTKP